MKESLFRNSYFFFVTCCLIILVINCKEEEPAPEERKLALTFLREGLSATSEVFVTDPDGNVLERVLNDGELAFFTTKTAAYYQLTIIDLIAGKSYFIKTYQKVPSSSYFIKSSPAPGDVAGLHRISFPNIADYLDFNMQAEHLYATLPVNDTEYDLQLTQATSDLFLTIKKNTSSTTDYLIRKGAEVGKATLIDDAVLNQFKPMLAKELTSKESLTNSYRYHIYGNIGTSKQLFVSSYEPPEIISTPKPVNLYYPETFLFNNYTTHVSYDELRDNYLATISLIRTEAVPAEIVELPNAKLISYQQGNGTYQFAVTGKADCTRTVLHAIQGDKSIYWEVYAPFSEQNTIQVPAFLISYLQEKQFSFANELKFRLIECIDDYFVIYYSDFLQLELKKDGTVKFTKDRLTTSYNLPQ